MAHIKPFRAVRPRPELAKAVSAPPYDVLSVDEARAMARDNAYSFLHISRSETDLPEGINPYSAEVYEKARDNLQKAIADGVLIKESFECLYIYALTMEGRIQTGIAACASVADYENGIIKRHELTREDKENDRTRHIEYCNANTGPVFLAHRENSEIRRRVSEWTANKPPLYGFTAEDGVEHRVWRIDDAEQISAITDAFSKLTLYIADGHHRNASAARVARSRGGQAGFYLAVIFPESDLKIMSYNRLVKDLNGHTPESFLEKLLIGFEVSETPEAPEKHSFCIYLRGSWYKLRAKACILEGKDSVGLLDVSILQDEVLSAILGIKDPRSDKRIDFVGGVRGRAELEQRVDSGEMELAVEMYPTSMAELMDIADAGRIMPPKSTWFEPKLRSGLFVHELFSE